MLCDMSSVTAKDVSLLVPISTPARRPSRNILCSQKIAPPQLLSCVSIPEIMFHDIVTLPPFLDA